MQDLSQLSLEQLQQVKLEKEENIRSWTRWVEQRENFLYHYYRGEAGIDNLQEFLAETQKGREKIIQWQKEIQEIDSLIAQYQNPSNPSDNDSSQDSILTPQEKARLESLQQAFVSTPPPPKQKPIQPKSA